MGNTGYMESEAYRKDIGLALESVVNSYKLKRKNVLLTGAAGLIGSFLADMLMHANEHMGFHTHVYAVGRSRARLEERFPDWIGHECFHMVEHDIQNKLDFDLPVDYIIHAAGNSYPAAFAGDPVGTIEANVTGSKNLLDYGRACSVDRFLFISSGEVYGQLTGQEAFREDMQGYVDPMDVRSCYPMGKRMAENLCVGYKEQYGSPVLIARPSHTYGANVTGQDNRATAQFLARAAAGGDIVLKSKGDQMRSYTYIADCASGLLTVLLEGVIGEAYNIANENARITIAGFAGKAARIAGTRVITGEADSVENPMKYAVLDTTKLGRLGWNGKYTVEQGIRSTLEILRDKGAVKA